VKKSDLESYRSALVDKRADLLHRVKAARAAEATRGDNETPDLGDRAVDAFSRDITYELTVSEREIVRRIDRALERIDAGTYGACLHCHQPIQPGRLAAVPWARHCIACQELHDRGEI
jgi:DnaK suppressor protein